MKKFIIYINYLLVTITCLFAFVGCASNQDLLDKINDLEAKLAEQTEKVEVLELAHTDYLTKINALEQNSTSFETDLKQLSEDFDAFADQLANASKIERTVLLPEDINSDNPIARCINVSVSDVVVGTKTGVTCGLNYSVEIYPYQLVTFNVTLHAFDTNLNYDLVTLAPQDDSSYVGKTQVYDFEYDESFTVSFNYLVLYRFL